MVRFALALALCTAAGCGGSRSREERQAQEQTVAADAVFDRGDARGAVPLYEQVLQAKPDHPRALLRLGMAYERLAMVVNAVQAYDKVLTSAPHSPEAAEARRRRDRLEQLRTWNPDARPAPKEILE